MRRLNFYAAIATEEQAVAFCREKGLLARGHICPICFAEMEEEQGTEVDQGVWACRRTLAGVRHQRRRSIRTGSIFFDSGMPVRTSLLLLYEWSRSTAVDEAAYQLSLTKRTVRAWYVKFRELIAWKYNQEPFRPIGGPGQVVEIDECQLGRRKHHRGRAPNARWFFGGVVRGTHGGEFFIEPVRKRDKVTLYPIIRGRIHPASTIISDGAAVYRDLPLEGLTHRWVNHSENFVSPSDPQIHTQNVENLWRCVRRFLSTHTNYNRKHLNSHITEFHFRRSGVDSFERMLSIVQEKCQLP